ncbi:MAG: hypothetical protein WBC04_04030 [Candidatus Acidiferrales bacterium]|jgi:hypothetical protein
MYVCRECDKPINQASEICPYCGADLTAAPPDETTKPKKRSLVKVIFYWGIVIGSLWAIVWFALPLRFVNPSAQAESRALEAMSNLRAALHSYAAAEGGYPASLEALGEPARTAAQWAQSAGFELQYAPAQADSEGRVKNYTLLARPGNYGFRNFFSDESGVIRATHENRPATAQDPPV